MAKETKNSSNPALGVIVALVLVIIIGLAAYALTRQFKSQEEAPGSPASSNEEIQEIQTPSVIEEVVPATSTTQVPQTATTTNVATTSTGGSLATDPITFSDPGPNILVTREMVNFPFTSQQLAERARACGIDKTASYWDAIAGQYAGVQVTKFTFSDTQPHAGGDFYVTVVPNATNVKSVTELKQIFNQCAPSANYNLYPYLVSSKSLVFETKCDATATLPNGCVVARSKVQPSLSVK